MEGARYLLPVYKCFVGKTKTKIHKYTLADTLIHTSVPVCVCVCVGVGTYAANFGPITPDCVPFDFTLTEAHTIALRKCYCCSKYNIFVKVSSSDSEQKSARELKQGR